MIVVNDPEAKFANSFSDETFRQPWEYWSANFGRSRLASIMTALPHTGAWPQPGISVMGLVQGNSEYCDPPGCSQQASDRRRSVDDATLAPIPCVQKGGEGIGR